MTRAPATRTIGVTTRPTTDATDLLVSRLRARGRSELLDRFDGTQRPIAIVYDPWRRIDPASAPPLVELVAQPERSRRPRQPIPLLYNARWSLPAGRYSIELIAPGASAHAGESGRGHRRRGGGGAGATRRDCRRAAR